MDHPRSGEIILLSEPDAWFAYPFWFEDRVAPDYARTVAIHNKPGFDPCELFFGWPPGTVSFNTDKIHGTHGSNRPGMEIAWMSSLDIPEPPATQLDLARVVQNWMAP